MTCPYLEYRSSDESVEFDHERAYCTASGRFVSPMQADVCNDRFEFSHTTHCEIYKAAVEAEAEAAQPAGANGELPGVEAKTVDTDGGEHVADEESGDDESTEVEVR